jgi:outer membrane lipoprotein-sorting protein
MRFILYALCALSLPVSAQKATEILDQAATAFEKAGGVSIAFAMHVRGGAQSESFEGAIRIKGAKFTLATPDMHVWYDGQTQWTYMEQSREVNITEPQGDDLSSINPALLLRTYKKEYTASFKGESTAASGKTACDVELAPKKKGDIVKVNLQIEKLSSLPARISIEAKDGSHTIIQVNSFTAGLDQPDSLFTFDASLFPDAEVIDLRR